MTGNFTTYLDTVKEFVQEQGISGATFAVSKNGSIVMSSGYGWQDGSLEVPMARDARLRLANDETITQAAIVTAIEDGLVEPSTPVFPRLGLEPVPGRSAGADVERITVEHLRTHTSGIGFTSSGQGMLDEMAFEFGISADQWTSEHRARWLYSQDAIDVGGAARYSSDGTFLLRILIERLIAPRTLEDYLAENMGLSGLSVSHERMDGRQPNEGYVTLEPTWGRWMSLEDSLSVGASASGYASFFNAYSFGYELQSDGRYAPTGGGLVESGMPGTWSMALVDTERALSIAMIANNHGNFGELIHRLNRITYDGSPCLFGTGNPRDHLDKFQFIANVEQPDHYIHLEYGLLEASPALAGWWSAQWRLELVEDAHYRFRNRYTGQYLHMQGGLLDVGDVDPSSWSTHWQLVDADGGFRVQNRGDGQYLSIQGGVLTSSAEAAPANAEWQFCN
jgi:CubicO group peptidase (beta-lactamase class C family)